MNKLFNLRWRAGIFILSLIGFLFASFTLPANAQQTVFRDMDGSEWYYSSANKLAGLNILDTTKENFNASEEVNRAQMAKFVASTALGKDIASYQAENQRFLDLQERAWYLPYVSILSLTGLMQGDTDERGNLTLTFRPESSITRAEAATVFYRAIVGNNPERCESDIELPFKDVKKEDWFCEAAVWAYSAGYMKGQGDSGKFDPTGNLLRSEVVSIIDRSLGDLSPKMERKIESAGIVLRRAEVNNRAEEVKNRAEEVKDEAINDRLHIYLSPNTPEGKIVNKGEKNVALLEVGLVTEVDYKLNEITFTRGGVGLPADLLSLNLYKNGEILGVEPIEINTNKVTFEFDQGLAMDSGKNFLRLEGNFSQVAQGGDEHYFYLSGAVDVESNLMEGGSFPVTGNVFEIGPDENNKVKCEKTQVSLSDAVVSSQPIAGSNDVPALAFRIQAPNNCDIEVEELQVDVYANLNEADFANSGAQGDGKGNQMILNMKLYDENNLIGMEPLQLAGNDQYYLSNFDNLNLNIAAGQTVNLVAKVKLDNTEGVFALDVNPVNMNVEDMNANTLQMPNIIINSFNDPNYQVQHLVGNMQMEMGELVINENNSPPSAIAIAGEKELMVSQYNFSATGEPILVRDLTVINDLTGFFDSKLNAPSVKNITLKYPNEEGIIQTKKASFTQGGIKFTNLDLYVPEYSDTILQIYADISSKDSVGEEISGQIFRLGLEETNNIVNFEAMGLLSENAIQPVIVDGANVNPFVVRTSKPTFEKLNTSPALLNHAENTLYSFRVHADAAGDLTLARLGFKVSTSHLDLSDFKFYRNNHPIEPQEINIYEDSSDQSVAPGGSTLSGTGSYNIIVAFAQEQQITAGENVDYRLSARVENANENESVVTQLSPTDEDRSLVELIEDTNPNTGRLIGSLTSGIFDSVNDFKYGNALNPKNQNAVSHIWSDQSSENYMFSLVEEGGSYDWTNGHLLELNNLTTHVLIQ